MAFAQAQPRQGDLSSINITPLIDVMLVMLVIFMIAAPAFSQAIPLPLNGRTDRPPTAAPSPIELQIDAAGEVRFDHVPVPMSALESMFASEVVRAGDGEPPTLHIDASGEADYEIVAQVLARAHDAGLKRVRFRE